MLSETQKTPINEKPSYYGCTLAETIVTIRSADGAEFHVDLQQLTTASPVFADMSIVPQSNYSQESPNDNPVLDVFEPGEVWERILHMCSHPAEPAFEYAHIQPVLEAGKKFSIAGLKERVELVLCRPEHLDNRPVSVYALACAYGLPNTARLAARRTLRLGPVFEYVPELAAISGRAYHSLLEYRQRCSVAARAVVSRSSTQVIPDWVDETEIKNVVVCSKSECEARAHYLYARETDYHIRPSWLEYLGKLERSLEMRPDGSVASSTEMLEPVMVSAAECVACARKIYGQAMAFSKQVETRIEEEISKVELAV